jgi:hypothetical protein
MIDEIWWNNDIPEAEPLTAEKFLEAMEAIKNAPRPIGYRTVELVSPREMERRKRGEAPIPGIFQKFPIYE